MKSPFFGPAAVMAVVIAVLNLLDSHWLEGYRVTRATDDYNQGGVEATKSFHEMASEGLIKLNQSEGFQLARIRSIDEISKKAILRSWDHHHHPACFFQRKQHNNNNKTTKKQFQAVVLGGSISSRPSDNCYITPNQKPEEGRYSDILQYKLRQLGLQDATIHNRAQGSSTSMYSGLNIENLLDPSKEDIDLIIWEYSVNDNSNCFGGTADKMLSFFLSRLEYLHRVVHDKSPPPVLLLYVWKANMGGYPKWKIRKGGIGYAGSVLDNSLGVVDTYRDSKRLDVQVLMLSNIIDQQAMIDDRKSFLDDNHHPACLANHLIADVLQYVLFVDNSNSDGIVACDNNNNSNNNKKDKLEEERLLLAATGVTDALAANTATNKPSPDSSKQQLLGVLLDSRTIIRAISDWQPSLPKDHRIENDNANYSYFPSLLTSDSQERTKLNLAQFAEEKLVPGRKDRKISYRVPSCSSSNDNKSDESNHLEFTFASNDWQWLCVVYKGTNIVAKIINHGGGQAEAVVPLAGEGLSMSKIGSPMNDHVQKERNFDWIDLRQRDDHPHKLHMTRNETTTMTVSFCDNTTTETVTESPVTTTTTQGSWIHLLFTVKA